jgi:competence protein ComEC
MAWPRWAGRRKGLLPGWTVLAALLLGPLVAGALNRGTVELVVLDVGQGDALVLRSPAGRWILVDAGPRSESFDAGARTVLPYLRQRGVPALELLVLTHPDMDHVGGAPAILLDFPVEGVMDPGAAVGKEVFLDALHAAQARGVPWRVAGAGDSLNLDGVVLRVLAPDSAGRAMAGEDANAASLVLELRYGAFSALLTGDAPSVVEEGVIRRLLSPKVQLLKIGHHGSSTSTGAELLARTHPETALISVGRRNRYGHPHASVLQRMEAEGARVLRTDEDGTVVVKARKDGKYSVRGRLTGE